MPCGTAQLPLADHVHRLNASNEAVSAPRRLESEHRAHDALDGPIVLFDDDVESTWLAQLDVGLMVSVVADDCGGIGYALVDGDLLGRTCSVWLRG